jgi:hypothetical protein
VYPTCRARKPLALGDGPTLAPICPLSVDNLAPDVLGLLGSQSLRVCDRLAKRFNLSVVLRLLSEEFTYAHAFAVDTRTGGQPKLFLLEDVAVHIFEFRLIGFERFFEIEGPSTDSRQASD